MDAIEMLHNRVSVPVLLDPAPTQEQLDIMFRAAIRAPDHGGLMPWRFLVVKGDARMQLGDLFVKAIRAKGNDLAEDKAVKLQKKPLRAPMIIVAIAKTQAHLKVPEVEQIITAGCAAHGLLLAAYAQGLGAMWRSGEMAFDPVVKAGLGLQAHEQIIGFLYVGAAKRMRAVSQEITEGMVSDWNGKN